MQLKTAELFNSESRMRVECMGLHINYVKVFRGLTLQVQFRRFAVKERSSVWCEGFTWFGLMIVCRHKNRLIFFVFPI